MTLAALFLLGFLAGAATVVTLAEIVSRELNRVEPTTSAARPAGSDGT